MVLMLYYLETMISMNAFVKGGSIIPYQNANGIKRVATLETMPMSLIIALDQNNTAQGELYMDDGMSMNTLINNQYKKYTFSYAVGKLTITLVKSANDLKLAAEQLTGIYVYGFPAGGATQCCAFMLNGEKISLLGDVDSTTGVAKFSASENIYLYNLLYIRNKQC